MRRENRKLLLRRAGLSAGLFLLIAGLAAPASAVTVGRFFAHEDVFAEDVGYGVAETEEQAEAFDVPIYVNENLLYSSPSDPITQNTEGVDGTARLFTLTTLLADISITNTDATAGTASVVYQVTLPDAFLDERLSDDEDIFLFFATSLDVDVNGTTVSYLSRDVGLLIDDTDPDYALLQTAALGRDLFYPAVQLGDGENDSFALQFDVLGGLDIVDGEVVVPNLLVGGAYVTVIPEPATAALLGLGLGGLAFLGRPRG